MRAGVLRGAKPIAHRMRVDMRLVRRIQAPQIETCRPPLNRMRLIWSAVAHHGELGIEQPAEKFREMRGRGTSVARAVNFGEASTEAIEKRAGRRAHEREASGDDAAKIREQNQSHRANPPGARNPRTRRENT